MGSDSVVVGRAIDSRGRCAGRCKPSTSFTTALFHHCPSSPVYVAWVGRAIGVYPTADPSSRYPIFTQLQSLHRAYIRLFTRSIAYNDLSFSKLAMSTFVPPKSSSSVSSASISAENSCVVGIDVVLGALSMNDSGSLERLRTRRGFRV